MRWFARRPARGTAEPAGGTPEHLLAFASSRRGVEGFIEPETAQTPTTLVLVAGDGEWTRRRVGSVREARDLCSGAGIPVYDVAATGYPRRMREWTSRNRDRGPAQT